MLRPAAIVGLSALAVTGEAQMLRGIFMSSSESSWQPGLDGQMHHEVHEVESRMVRDGDAMQETHSRLDCMHGLCRKTVHVSDPGHVLHGRLPRFVVDMLQRFRSATSGEDYSEEHMPVPTQVDPGMPGEGPEAPRMPMPWRAEGSSPMHWRPMPQIRVPEWMDAPMASKPLTLEDTLQMPPPAPPAPFDVPDPVIGMMPQVRISISGPEPTVSEPEPMPVPKRFGHGFFRKVTNAIKATRAAEHPLTPVAALVAFSVLTLSALLVAVAACRCLRAESREIPLSVALGQPLAPESEVRHVAAPALRMAAKEQVETATVAAIADPLTAATKAYLVCVYARATAA